MHKLYSLSYFWSENYPRPAVVEAKLNMLSVDWIRFSNAQWFLWTSMPKQSLVNELQNMVLGNEQFAILGLQPEAPNGHAMPWIWDWLNDKMSRQYRGE